MGNEQLAAPDADFFAATEILDYDNDAIQLIKDEIANSNASPRDYLRAAHRYFSEKMNAVYSIDELRPVSETIKVNGGSCSQRMACVEALARANDIPTRSRALWLDGKFWRHRLPLLQFFLPKRTVIPWTQFYIDGQWLDFDELYAPLPELAEHSAGAHPFTNAGESLYSAISHLPIDFLGKLGKTKYAAFDLSRFVVGDDGFFVNRDELLRKFDKRSWFGKWIFNLLYGGRPIRRMQQ